MDCKTFRSVVESYLKNGMPKKVLSTNLERHLQSCAICRDRYASQLEYNKVDDQVIANTDEIRAISPSADDLLDPFPDISDPIEFKDAPITFTLLLDGRKEEIKVVEPEVDFPLPRGGQLVVRENEAILTDVVFRFHPEKKRPYELHFTVKTGVSYAEPHVCRYGKPVINDKVINDPFEVETQEGEMLISPETVDDWDDGYYIAYPDDGSKPYAISPAFVRQNYEAV